jgi:hypothetical protein
MQAACPPLLPGAPFAAAQASLVAALVHQPRVVWLAQAQVLTAIPRLISQICSVFATYQT